MSQASHNNQIDYIEFPAVDIPKIKEFYSSVFGWKFEDSARITPALPTGVLRVDSTRTRRCPLKGILVVLYASDLEGTEAKVKAAGAKISKEIFSFPGGRRFHFMDPSGNELAVWSE